MSYIGNEPIVSATRTVTEITATAGQTVFTANGGYTVGYIDVFVNGAQLQSADFTATDGSTVVLTQAAQVGDVVRLVAWGTFSSANITSGSLSAGGITWSQSGGVTLPRIDSSNEGGQLNFNRASDNTATWSIDSFGNTSTPSLRFVDGANVRAVIDGSGNVGIGTSSPSFPLQVSSGTSGNISFMVNPPGLTNFAVIPSNSGSTGTRIGTTGGDTFAFITNNTERMRIDSSGNAMIGTTTSGGRLTVSTATGSYVTRFITEGNNQDYIAFVSATNIVGSVVRVGGTNVAYNTSSDYRLKENIVPMTGALAKVQELKPCNWTWKLDGTNGQGFIAHELQKVCPDAVSGTKDEVDEEGNPKYQGVDTSFLVATLTAAIQELKSIVDNQKIELDNAKAEIELLKGAN